MSVISKPSLKLCLAGIGGYAINHHAVVHEMEEQGKVRLLAACDPRHERLGSIKERFLFEERGVEILTGFDEMMTAHAAQSHFVSIATPIHAHAMMHQAVAASNLGCYLEKPPTLDPVELESMIAAERASDFRTEVGFSYLTEQWRQRLKQRLLDGEWGALRSLSLYGAWDRDENYYQRTSWAGKLMLQGRLVLDSPFGNAVSHNVHNLLFFAGKGALFSWAQPQEVRAELYRACAIEGADTVFSEMTTTDGIPLRVALSHACRAGRDLLEVIECDEAEIRIKPYESYEIIHRSGKREWVETDANANLLRDHFNHYQSYLNGDSERPLTGLADCRPFVWWNALNYIASGQIHPVSERFCDVNAQRGQVSIRGVEEGMRAFNRTGVFPSQQGYPWGGSGGIAQVEELSSLVPCVDRMARCVGVTG